MYPGYHNKMICLETEYFILSKILLHAVGLWPYQQSILTRLQFIFFLGISMATIILQVKLYFYYTKILHIIIMSIIIFHSLLLYNSDKIIYIIM